MQRSAAGDAVAVAAFDDAAGRGQDGQTLVEGGGANAAMGAQLCERQRAIGVGESGSDALVE